MWRWRENNRDVVVVEGKQQKCGGAGGANNSTRPYLYDIPAHFCHELKTKGYDVIGVNFYPRQTNEIPLQKNGQFGPYHTTNALRFKSALLCSFGLTLVESTNT